MRNTFSFLIAILIELTLNAQLPKHNPYLFKSEIDTSTYKVIVPERDGFQRNYIITNLLLWDINQDNTAFIKRETKVYIIVEGNMKDHKFDGIFSYFLLDSLNPKRKHKVWEDTYLDDKLNGRRNIFSSNGVLCFFETYSNDSLNGIAREFGIDGKSIVTEFEYLGGAGNGLRKTYFSNGKIQSEAHFKNFKTHGLSKRYYENGNLLEVSNFTNNESNGTWKYYHPNGQLWLEKIYKMGKSWEVVANFSSDGQKRNPGTLKNGNGSTIYYKEDGTIREIVTYKDGIEMN